MRGDPQPSDVCCGSVTPTGRAWTMDDIFGDFVEGIVEEAAEEVVEEVVEETIEGFFG